MRLPAFIPTTLERTVLLLPFPASILSKLSFARALFPLLPRSAWKLTFEQRHTSSRSFIRPFDGRTFIRSFIRLTLLCHTKIRAVCRGGTRLGTS